MNTVFNVADMVEDNGQTIRQNNLAKTHKIALGTLVEVKYDTWFGNGACEKVHARLFVVKHNRDCDGTPLYSLCQRPDPENYFNFLSEISGLSPKQIEFITKGFIHSGYAEESLTVIPVTEDIKQGKEPLAWPYQN